MNRRKKLRKKLKVSYSKEQLQELFENKLRAKTIPSGKVYNRKKLTDD